MEREAKIEVGRPEVAAPASEAGSQVDGHRAANDRQVPAPERAAERPEHVASDTEEPFRHWIVVCAGARVVIGHGPRRPTSARRARTHAARGRAEFDPQVSRQHAWVTSASLPAASTVTAIRIHPSLSHSRMRSTASSGTSQVAWNWCTQVVHLVVASELHPSTGRALANAFDREDQTRLRRRSGRSGHQPGRRRHRVARGRP